MARDEKIYEQVGDIKIKESKIKKAKKKKKSSTSETSLGTKIFVWFMFIAMLGSFAIPLVSYFISLLTK